ncbi:craniofacial development protein 2-like [Schistocerca nitens]|uniref:craniofacial development protein 2-like n=1 Tax=Schistocerca nitens TaxID=7011 RepID=UPI00211757E9|nr:craniofacial development protein 2-like [Schistocerca nitens]
MGKMKQLRDTLDRFKTKICALQETIFPAEDHFNPGNYRMYKGKPLVHRKDLRVCGTGFAVHRTISDAVMDFTLPNKRLSTLTIKSAYRAYTVVNAHAQTNDHNRKDLDATEDFWTVMEETIKNTPKHRPKLILGDFKANLGKEQKYRHIAQHRDTNLNGNHLIEFCQTHDLKVMSTNFKEPTQKLTTGKLQNGKRELQIDHVIIQREPHREIPNIDTRKCFFHWAHHLLKIKTGLIPKETKIFRPDPEYLNTQPRENTGGNCDRNNAKLGTALREA